MLRLPNGDVLIAETNAPERPDEGKGIKGRVMQYFMKRAGAAAPSANRFGRISPTRADHVLDEFDPGLLVLDGGPCQVGIESSIVDCSRGRPVLLRPGVITRAQLEAAAGERLLDRDAAVGAAWDLAGGALAKVDGSVSWRRPIRSGSSLDRAAPEGIVVLREAPVYEHLPEITSDHDSHRHCLPHAEV